jgi:Flp pilus assembly pilin Flp
MAEYGVTLGVIVVTIAATMLALSEAVRMRVLEALSRMPAP